MHPAGFGYGGIRTGYSKYVIVPEELAYLGLNNRLASG
jgi:hypothetical protein